VTSPVQHVESQNHSDQIGNGVEKALMVAMVTILPESVVVGVSFYVQSIKVGGKLNTNEERTQSEFNWKDQKFSELPYSAKEFLESNNNFLISHPY